MNTMGTLDGCPIPATLRKNRHPHRLMTFSESLLNTADNNGCIAWVDAYLVACDHHLRREFQESYGRSFAAWGYTGVDAGEFLVWLGY